MTEKRQPTTADKRIQILDVLRGTAIFGILAVNMPLMNAPLTAMLTSLNLWPALPDRIIRFIIYLFFEGKFYTMFSLLFGYGFWLFINKAGDSGRPVLALYRRRLFILLIIGILHLLLLWGGDILVFYALLGFLLILFRKASDKKIRRWAIALILVPIVLTFILVLLLNLAALDPEAAVRVQADLETQENHLNSQVMTALEVYAEGSFAEIVGMRLVEWLTLLPGLLFFYPNVLAMFLLGLLAARNEVLARIDEFRPLLVKALCWGLLIGLPANLVYAWSAFSVSPGSPTWTGFLGMFCFGFGAPALALAYVSGLVLVFRRGGEQPLFGRLAAVGRLALSNYLLHSLVAALLYHSYGLGLFGRVSIWQGFLITLAVFSAQLILSPLWLRRYRFGPAEWLWRTLTYRSGLAGKN